MVSNRTSRHIVTTGLSVHARVKHKLVVCATLVLATLQILSAQERLLPVFNFRPVTIPFTGSILARIVRDQNGLIWIGTFRALQKFDGYSSKIYRNNPDDLHSISSSDVRSLLLDSRKLLWIGTYETGLSLYNAQRDWFVNFPAGMNDSTWEGGRREVYAIAEDLNGDLWLGTSSGVVHVTIPAHARRLEADSLATAISFETYPVSTPGNAVFDLLELETGAIAVASDSGLLLLDPSRRTLSRLNLSGPSAEPLNSDLINCLARGPGDKLWVGTGTDGVFVLDRKTRNVVNYRHRENDGTSLKSDDIHDIVRDREDRMWIASPNGVDLLDPTSGKCIPHLNSPPGGIRMSLSVDSVGVLWVANGTGELYCLTPKGEHFPRFSFKAPDGSPKSIFTINMDRDGTSWASGGGGILYQVDFSSGISKQKIDLYRGKRPELIYPDNTTALLDRQGILWYGTWGLGLLKVDLSTGAVTSYKYRSSLGNSSYARSIAEGSNGVLWISANRHGLLKFDIRSAKFHQTPIKNPARVMRDHEGMLWVTTEGDGLLLYNPKTGSVRKFVHRPSDSTSLASNRTLMTYEDPDGRIWVTAGRVIHLWNPVTGSFLRYTPELIWSDDPILLGSDLHGRLWIAFTAEKVTILNPSNGEFITFDKSDGICGTVYDMQLLEDGRIVLAGWEGLTFIDPDHLDTHRPVPPFSLTKISVNDVAAVPSMMSAGGQSLDLSHEENVLEFEFAAVDIDAPGGLVKYRYRLEGLEQEWVESQDRRSVRYPGLQPGRYTFRVKASSARKEWPEQEITLAVSIAPPWWKTTWAYAVYVCLLVGLLTGAYRLRVRENRLKQHAEMEHFRSEHLAEVDRLKSRFFANISHEFRTPLTLILGPLRTWREKAHDEKLAKDLRMAERNAQRLLKLVNQLLDLAKLEAGGMKLQAAPANIVPVVRGLAQSFESSAGMRDITLTVDAEEEEIEVFFDREKLEKILTNLLSNAFKFTSDGGSVVCTVKRGSIRSPAEERETVIVSVSDTGIGIPADEIDRIFDRFHQVDASYTRKYEGSGIGLALTKELVDLHHGTIQAESVVGKGSTFTVLLPLGRTHLHDDEIAEGPVEHGIPGRTGEFSVDHVVEEEGETTTPHGDGAQPIVLIIEDNADVRAYIREYLASSYEVREARDGEEGINRAQETIPDLIISDVMMPKQDGYAVCRTLKTDERTCHIPVILLTAKAGSESKIEGLETGADDYLVKPFEPKELLARVKNLIELRKTLRQRFSMGTALRPGEVAVSSLDDVFLKKVIGTVERNIGDENFGVEDLAREACLGRVQLYRKLRALTSLSPAEFIRYIRLHRAMDLLKKNAGTVAEVAYSVGYGNSSHFAARFREIFGITPGDVRKTQDRPEPF
jgi:signal transduction histidine kinase/ligand-binding sensor domain-containing protein/CheY-like chemotaxis protein/AraC-like DNA-binding protein